jgi:hypothetical protein
MSNPHQVLEQHTHDIQELQASQKRNTELLEQILQQVASQPVPTQSTTDLPKSIPAISSTAIGPKMPLPNEYNGDRAMG